MLAGASRRGSSRSGRLGLWFWWVVASVVGGLATLALMAWLSLWAEWLYLHGLGWIGWGLSFGWGLCYAIPQWLVLRRVIRGAAGWIPVTSIGLALTLVIPVLGANWVRSIAGAGPQGLVYFGLVGALGLLVGIAQLRVVLRRGRRGEQTTELAWLVASTLGNACLGSAPLLIGNGVGFNNSLAHPVGLGGLSGAIYGTITGLGLAWLLRGRSDNRSQVRTGPQSHPR